MIIGINGKIGSGKDTIGKIIQYLVVKKRYTELITDDFKEFHEEYKNSDKPLIYSDNGGAAYSDFEIKKFAGKLKQTASLLTGIPVEKFEDQEFKQKHMGLQWKMTYREFLQKLGTDALRDGLHTDVWVNALFADYKPESTGYNYLYPHWIITDMRFPNEMEAVEEREGLTIRVVRNNGTRAIDINPHASETALDDAEFDYEIINDGTIEDLIEKVREILIKEEII